MKTDHSFTFTAAVVLAGVVLAFVSPADAVNAAPATAVVLENSSVPATATNTVATLDSHASAKGETKHKGSCERGVKRPAPQA